MKIEAKLIWGFGFFIGANSSGGNPDGAVILLPFVVIQITKK